MSQKIRAGYGYIILLPQPHSKAVAAATALHQGAFGTVIL